MTTVTAPSTHATGSAVYRILYQIPNWRLRELFVLLRTYCQGDVIDIGGHDFVITAREKELDFRRWVTVEVDKSFRCRHSIPSASLVIADGVRLPISHSSCDTALCLHVLEHVFEPLDIVREMKRVLRPGGHGIVMVPQTSPLHLIPHHYQNFTIYWLREACRRLDLELVEQRRLGGFWSSVASRMMYFYLESGRVAEYSSPEYRRNGLFYLLFPLMAVWAALNILVGLIFAWGDLTEEPNNLVVVFRVPSLSPEQAAPRA